MVEIKWLKEDFEEALVKNGFKKSDKNIQLLVENGLLKVLKDLSIQNGWEIIDDVMSSIENLEGED